MRLNKLAALGASLLLAAPLVACGAYSSTNAEVGKDLEQITEMAKEEGTVNLIALPDTWAN